MRPAVHSVGYLGFASAPGPIVIPLPPPTSPPSSHPDTPKYIIGDLLGSGEFGDVHNCVQVLPSGARRTCAIKVMDVQLLAGKGDSQTRTVADFLGRMENEMLIQSFLRHPGIIEYIDHLSVVARKGYPAHMSSLAGFAGAEKFLVMDLACGPELFDSIATLTPDEMRSAVAQVGRALLYLHRLSPPIAHRDIKPENLAFCRLPDGGVRCQVFDFGLSREIGTTHSQRGVTKVGTITYVAPEVTKSSSHDTQVDDFSLGLTLAVMVGNSPPKRNQRGGIHPNHFRCTVQKYSDSGQPYYCCDDQGRTVFTYIDSHTKREVPKPCDGGVFWARAFEVHGAFCVSLLMFCYLAHIPAPP